MTKKKKITLVVVLLLLAGFATFTVLSYQKNQAKSGVPKGAVMVSTEEVKTDTIVSKVSVKGKADLVNKRTVFPDTQAKIKTLHVKLGDTVTEGQVLVTYDEKALDETKNQLLDAKLALKSAQLNLEAAKLPAFEADILSGENQISQAQKGVVDAKNNINSVDLEISQINSKILDKQSFVEKTRKLYDEGIISKNDLDKEELELKSLNSQLETIENNKQKALAALDAAESNLNYSKEQNTLTKQKPESKSNINRVKSSQVQVEQANLKIAQLEKSLRDFKQKTIAPVSGTVTTLGIKEGQIASFTGPIMDISDISVSNMVIKVDIPESTSSGVSVGQEVIISGDSLGKAKYKGKVSKIYPIAEVKQTRGNPETVIFADVTISDNNAPIRPGFTLDTDIITKTTKDALVVPVTALQTDENGKDFVYVLAPQSKVEKRLIEQLDFSGLKASITNVKVGEKVITNPPTTLNENSVVKEMDPATSPVPTMTPSAK